MELRDAIRMAGQILDQERMEPTVGYATAEPVPVVSAFAALAGPLTERGKKHPRSVQEHPEEFQFKSTNFDLLCALLEQVPEQTRPALLGSTLSRISDARSFRHRYPELVKAGSWTFCSSELPLLAEFLARRGDKQLLYVKGFLLPGMNLEVNQDKGRVRTFLEKLGFTQLLIQSLDEAERLYRTSATPFELKSSIGHLRSFLEQLHVQACALAHKKFGGLLPSRWGDAVQYLRDQDILTVKEQQFAIQFYALMSDTSVHPLVAKREYARLMRNMSIEYGLLLLTKLDKLGLNQSCLSP
jgi:hypothetical protein